MEGCGLSSDLVNKFDTEDQEKRNDVFPTDDGLIDDTRPSTSFSDNRAHSPFSTNVARNLPADLCEDRACNADASTDMLGAADAPGTFGADAIGTSAMLSCSNPSTLSCKSESGSEGDFVAGCVSEVFDAALHEGLNDTVGSTLCSTLRNPLAASGEISDAKPEAVDSDECEIDEDDDGFECDIESVTVRKEKQMKNLHDLLENDSQYDIARRPSVGESGMLTSPKEPPKDCAELQATIRTLKEKLRERELQKRDALGDLMDARKQAWEWKLENQRAQAQLRELIKLNEGHVDLSLIQFDENVYDRRDLGRGAQAHQLDLAISQPKKRRDSVPASSTKVHDYLLEQEGQIRKLTSELCDARMIAVTYLKIIEERTELIHQLESEFAEVRVKQIMSCHPAGEIITPTFQESSHRRLLFTVQEESDRPRRLSMDSLRPVPPPPLTGMNWIDQMCSPKKARGSAMKPILDAESPVAKTAKADAISAAKDIESTQATENVAAAEVVEENAETSNIAAVPVDEKESGEESGATDAKEASEHVDAIPHDGMVLNLPPIEPPSLPTADAADVQPGLSDVAQHRVRSLVSILECVREEEQLAGVARFFNLLKAIAGAHCAAAYIQCQIRVFLARNTMNRLRMERALTSSISEAPSTLTDSSWEPLGKPSKLIPRPKSVPPLLFSNLPSYCSSGDSFGTGTYSYGCYTQYENRSAQTSMRGADIVALRSELCTSHADQFFRDAKPRPEDVTPISEHTGPKPTLDPRKKKPLAKAKSKASLRPLPSDKRKPPGIKIAWSTNSDAQEWPADIVKSLSAMKSGKFGDFSHKTIPCAKPQSRLATGSVHTHHHHHYHVFVDPANEGSPLVYPLRPTSRTTTSTS